MELGLAKKSVLITGGSKDIGLACAHAWELKAWHRQNLARAGLRVVEDETLHDGRELWLVAERR